MKNTQFRFKNTFPGGGIIEQQPTQLSDSALKKL